MGKPKKFENFDVFIGQTLNRLTVLEVQKRLDSQNKEIDYFLCRCVCGKEKFIRAFSVASERTKSCGCLNKEILPISGKKHALPNNGGILNVLFAEYRNGANIRGYEFSLSNDQFSNLIKQGCFYCGRLPYKIVKRRNASIVVNGIDRVDNTKGYSVENCVPCCSVCNKAKMQMETSEFYKWIEMVYNHMKGKSREVRM